MGRTSSGGATLQLGQPGLVKVEQAPPFRTIPVQSTPENGTGRIARTACHFQYHRRPALFAPWIWKVCPCRRIGWNMVVVLEKRSRTR